MILITLMTYQRLKLREQIEDRRRLDRLRAGLGLLKQKKARDVFFMGEKEKVEKLKYRPLFAPLTCLCLLETFSLGLFASFFICSVYLICLFVCVCLIYCYTYFLNGDFMFL